MKNVILFSIILALAVAAQDKPSLLISCPPTQMPTAQTQDGQIRVTCEPTPTPKPAVVAAVGIVVAPDGKPTNAGTFAAPLDLATAISANSPAKPGSTIWLRGGSYKGIFTISFVGTKEQPITVRSYPSEWAVIDGGTASSAAVVTLNAAYQVVRDVEVTCTGADRTKALPSGFSVMGAGDKVINCIVHDTGGGFGLWTPALEAEVYGNVIFNNGWQGADPDRGHGHGVYVQGDTGNRFINDNVIFGGYGYGLHAYTFNGTLRGINADGNFIFQSGTLARQPGAPNVFAGGYSPPERMVLTNNVAYDPIEYTGYNFSLYYDVLPEGDVTLRGNTIVGGGMLFAREWKQFTATDNTIIGQGTVIELAAPSGVAASAYKLDRNSYTTVGATPNGFQPFHDRFAGQWAFHTFAQWQALGYDVSGQWRRVATAAEVAPIVIVRPNKYEPKRAHVAVVALNGAASVSVDLKDVLAVGDAFEVYDVRDLKVPVVKDVWAGKPVALPVNKFSVFLVRQKR